MKFFNIIFFSLLSIQCFAQEDTLKTKKQTDSIKIKKDNRFKVAGSVIADSFLSVPGDFSAMGHNVSSDWKRTALYTAGIIGLIAVDKHTTGFLHEHIEPNINYNLPDIGSKSPIPYVIGDDPYIVYPIIGLYAVFIHKGPSPEAEKSYRFIFTEWLPDSKYFVDDRPHFAIMTENYKKDDPDSEEEIWIPVKNKV